jgi:LmbE family N-acetylglucosaminyl deacetylase
MRSLTLRPHDGEPLRAVCLGAHSDDIEIGAGGLVRQLADAGAEIHYVVLSGGDATRRDEAERSAATLLAGAKSATVVIESFRESYFPWIGDQVKDRFEVLKREVDPDVVITHHRHDRHQDHQVVAELSHNTFRNHLVLEYEIPKYEGDLTPTDLYVPLTQVEAAAKVDHIIESFPSQASRTWFDPETFWALLRLRGIESNAPDGYAESFHCGKAVLDVARAGGSDV